MKSTGDVRLSGSRMVRAEAWALVRARGYEGLVAKDSMAPYAASTRWCEVKVRHEARMLIGGIVVTREGYDRLLVGALGGGDFRYLGCVKWGVGRRIIEAGDPCAGAPRADSPFADLRRRAGVVWFEPRLTVG